MADNNIASVKVGNKVFSWDGSYTWTDVTATYPYVGNTIQTEFDIYPGPASQVLETGGYFIYHDMIWRLAKLSGIAPDPDFIVAAPLYPTAYSSVPQLPIFIDAYENGSTLYSDDQYEHKLTEIPQNGDSFYIIDGNPVLIQNAVIYDTITAGSTATDVPPAVVVHEWQRYRNGSLLPFKPVTINKTADDGKLLAYDATSDSIKPTNKNVAEYDPSAVIEGDPLVFDDTGKIASTNELTLANITVTDTATINHATIVTEEDIHSEADFIELRVGNPLPTPSTGSGFKVKNYDGDDEDLELVTDSSGTFRIGAENQLQPIATREEASVLNNNDLFAWDATANQLKHITRPTINGTALKAIVTNGAVTGYDWGSSGGSGVSFIGTRAAYNTAKLIPEGQDGHIPAGSLVIITDEDEIVIGEDA